MSVFGPNQVEELIIVNGDAGLEASVTDFIANAVSGDAQLLSKDGGAIGLNKQFYALQKTAGNAARGLDYEFSDGINPRSVDRVKAIPFKEEKAKSILVKGFEGNVQQNATYEVFIRVYNDGGTMSTENFRFIYGSFVTDVNFAGTADDIVDGIIDNLNKTLRLSYTDSGSFVVSKSTSPLGVQIDSLIQPTDMAKNTGRPIEFDVQVAVKDNCNTLSCSTPGVYNFLEAEITEKGDPGVGTGKIVANLEWFTKGYKYEAYRGTAYPVDFNTPYYADLAGEYNMIHINYFKERSSVNVEKQHRVLTIAIKNDADFAKTDAILADIRTATGMSITELPDLGVA